jgi:hypothetical protein
MSQDKLKKILEAIEPEIVIAEHILNVATDEELEGMVGTLDGINMRDYSKGALDILKIVKKIIEE